MKKKILYTFLFFFSLTSLAQASIINKKYSKYVNLYFQELKEKGKNSRGAMAVSKEGYPNFSVGKNKSQKFINKQVLDDCNIRGTKCIIVWQGFKKNPNYKSLTYNRSSSTAEFQGKKFKVQLFYNYGNVKIFKVQEDVILRGSACGKYKSSESDKKIDKIIKSSIASFPAKFISNSGLENVLLCGQTISSGHKGVSGLAISDAFGTTGVFLAKVNLHQTFKNAKLHSISSKRIVKDIHQKCLEKKRKKKLTSRCPKFITGDIEGGVNHFLKIFSHELYHIIDFYHGYGFNDPEWSSLNKFDYREDFILGGSHSEGFVSAYGQKNMLEDKAVIFESMVSDRFALTKKLKNDKILFDKSKLLIKRLKRFYPNINQNFWKSFDKVRLIKY